MPYGDTRIFFPNHSAADRVAIYAIWGGVPAYWERLDTAASVIENVRKQLLPANTLMQEEPRILLQDFISDPHNYVGILRAIAGGAHTQSRISSHTGLSKGHISKYLSVLRNSGFVARQVPVTEDAAKSRRGHYFVTDPYLRFYYRFFAAYQAKLALGEQQQILESIEQSLPEFIQNNTWQELCREWLLRSSAQGEIPVPIEQVGGAWARNYDCDVVGISKEESSLVLGTSLWEPTPAGFSAIQELVMKTQAIIPQDGLWSVYYLGFASSGWSDEAVAYAKSLVTSGVSGKNWRPIGARLLDLDEVDSDLIRWSSTAGYDQARLL
jgi:hypothetical protein